MKPPPAPKRIDFIEHKADAFEARIGERGRLLSGGERQRLAVARALLKDPPILILDEATSALDPVTEQRVTQALDEVMKGRTTFVIAHRLATIRNASRILVFQDGRIIETGTFDELYQGGGFFSELVDAQFGAEAPLGTVLQSLDTPVVPQERTCGRGQSLALEMTITAAAREC